MKCCYAPYRRRRTPSTRLYIKLTGELKIFTVCKNILGLTVMKIPQVFIVYLYILSDLLIIPISFNIVSYFRSTVP